MKTNIKILAALGITLLGTLSLRAGVEATKGFTVKHDARSNVEKLDCTLDWSTKPRTEPSFFICPTKTHSTTIADIKKGEEKTVLVDASTETKNDCVPLFERIRCNAQGNPMETVHDFKEQGSGDYRDKNGNAAYIKNRFAQMTALIRPDNSAWFFDLKTNEYPFKATPMIPVEVFLSEKRPNEPEMEAGSFTAFDIPKATGIAMGMIPQTGDAIFGRAAMGNAGIKITDITGYEDGKGKDISYAFMYQEPFTQIGEMISPLKVEILPGTGNWDKVPKQKNEYTGTSSKINERNPFYLEVNAAKFEEGEKIYVTVRKIYTK